MSSHRAPITQPASKDPNNWESLTNKEATIRAKAVEKGHEPHDWRWMFNKVFKTNKAYPKSMRENVEATNTAGTSNQDPQFRSSQVHDAPVNTEHHHSTHIA